MEIEVDTIADLETGVGVLLVAEVGTLLNSVPSEVNQKVVKHLGEA